MVPLTVSADLTVHSIHAAHPSDSSTPAPSDSGCPRPISSSTVAAIQDRDEPFEPYIPIPARLPPPLTSVRMSQDTSTHPHPWVEHPNSPHRRTSSLASQGNDDHPRFFAADKPTKDLTATATTAKLDSFHLTVPPDQTVRSLLPPPPPPPPPATFDAETTPSLPSASTLRVSQSNALSPSASTKARRSSSTPTIPGFLQSTSPRCLQFPDAFERALAPFDDPLIPPVQRLWRLVPVRCFFLSITVLTAIEAALPVPAALYALGHDASAGLVTSTLLVLAFASQIPKKLLFRPRPWMTRRAFPFRQDRTSSFPSRAVVCAVVFTWLAVVCTQYEFGYAIFGSSTREFQPQLLWTLLLVPAVVAALARVSAGAHYPSDTVSGFFLGLTVILLGMRLERSWAYFGCAILGRVPGISSRWALQLTAPHVHISSVPTPILSLRRSSSLILSFRDLFRQTPYFRLLNATMVSYFVTVVSVQGFWVKCDYVFGILFASATFRSVYACPARTGVTVGSLLPQAGLLRLVIVVAYFALLVMVGMKARTTKASSRLMNFTMIYLGTFVSILLWRLSPWLFQPSAWYVDAASAISQAQVWTSALNPGRSPV